MAQRIRYIGEPVLTLEEVTSQTQGVPLDQEALVRDIIIPGVTAQCEAKTGAAIRRAEYVEDWPATGRFGGCLDVGQAKVISSVQRLDTKELLSPTDYELAVGQHVSRLSVPGWRGVPLRITYEAWLDLACYPSVKTWLLMQAATVFGQRETLITGTIVAALPATFLDTLLSDITVPPRF